MADLDEEQLHWLRVLSKRNPRDAAPRPSIPERVSRFLLASGFAHIRDDEIEITFEGIKQIHHA